VETPARGQEVLDLQGGEFHQPVAEVRLETGGLGVGDDLTGHGL
jgi:hypothetical protein